MPSTPSETETSLLAALDAWLGSIRILCSLAQRQLAAIESDDAGLVDLLTEKEAAYRQADALSRRVTELGAGSRPDAEGLRAAIHSELTELARLEARSESQLRERLNGVRMELEGLRRGHTANFAYAPSSAASPRFLDQRR